MRDATSFLSAPAFPIASSLASCLAFSIAFSITFTACEPAEPARPPQPVSAFYECRGEPGYAGTWEEVIRGLNLDSRGFLPCTETSHETGSYRPEQVLPPERAVKPESVSVPVRILVLNAQCRPLTEVADTLSLPAGTSPFSVWPRGWNGRLSDGTKMPSGEYYVNTEWRWEDGRRDTTWEKMGMIVSACGD